MYINDPPLRKKLYVKKLERVKELLESASRLINEGNYYSFDCWWKKFLTLFWNSSWPKV